MTLLQKELRDHIIESVCLTGKALVWASESGLYRSYQDKNRIVTLGTRGVSDIIGIMNNGKFIAIQICMMREPQHAFRKIVEERNGIYIVSGTVLQVLQELDTASKKIT